MVAQARRKPPAKSGIKRGGNQRSGMGAGITMLVAGMVIGSLATIMWQGAQTGVGIGAGIRRIMENTAQPSATGDAKTTAAQPAQSAKPSTPFDFFTVLPEIEIVAPPTAPPAPATPAATQNQSNPPSTPTAAGSAYMLQAASYRRREEADQLKATLALNGLVSVIQKISIQGKGDFYRVRLGPFSTYQAMEAAQRQLSRAGIQALRLKVSTAG